MNNRTDRQVTAFINRTWAQYAYDYDTRIEKLSDFSAKYDLTIAQYELIQDAILGEV